jgi:LacI family repressor for deo operon, udp, cdd, tsx, nupC, and nupG
MTKIQDVARTANVSVATVSRVINNSSSVTAKTRQKVEAVVRALNYQPNLLGRNLRRTKSHIALVLIPNISNPFYSRIVKGIEDIAHSNGYNVMLCNTDSDAQREHAYVDILKNKLADGIIFMASELSVKEMREISSEYPLVQCCEYLENLNVSHVSIDNFSAAYEATTHLCSLGSKRVGFIGSSNNYISTIKREEGYKKALLDAGVKYDKTLVKYGNYSYKSAYTATLQMLEKTESRPDAIFAISDIMAIGAINAIKGKGLRVPDDIAVCGFDDISFASMFNPAITTVSQPTYEMGCAAMKILLSQINQESSDKECVILAHNLIVRATTDLKGGAK